MGGGAGEYVAQFVTSNTTGQGLSISTPNNVGGTPTDTTLVVKGGGGGKNFSVRHDGDITMDHTTEHGVIFGGGANPITDSGVLTHGELVIGNTGQDPGVDTINGFASTPDTDGILVTNGPGKITIKAVVHLSSNDKLVLDDRGIGIDESLEPTWTKKHIFKDGILVTKGSVDDPSFDNGGFPVKIRTQDGDGRMFLSSGSIYRHAYGAIGAHLLPTLNYDDNFNVWND